MLDARFARLGQRSEGRPRHQRVPFCRFLWRRPRGVLQAWRDHRLDVVLSVAIFNEYQQAGERLATRFGGVDIEHLLMLLAASCEFVDPVPLPQQLCTDRDDDKFIACALAAHCPVIVSGDRALLRLSGFGGVTVLRPRDFVMTHLEGE